MQKPILESNLWKEFVIKDDAAPAQLKPDIVSVNVPIVIPTENRVVSTSLSEVASKSISPAIKPVLTSSVSDIPESNELSKTPDETLSKNNCEESQINKPVSIKGSGKFKTQSFATPVIPVISSKPDAPIDTAVKQSTSNLTLPLYDILEEVFELHEHNWLRKQSLWMFTSIIEMSFDGVINDFLYTKVNEFTTEESLSSAIDNLTEVLWPDGKWMKTPVPVSEEEKEVYAKLAFERMLTFAKNQSYINSVLGDFYIEAGLTKYMHFFILILH